MLSDPDSPGGETPEWPGLLPRRVRLVALAAVALLVMGAFVVSVGRAARQVDGSQFAATAEGTVMYAVTVGLRALATPPLEYVALALGGALLSVVVFVPMLRVADWLGGKHEG
jgi:hypothetical protein